MDKLRFLLFSILLEVNSLKQYVSRFASVFIELDQAESHLVA